MARAKKPVPPDSYVAHDCVILGIDPARVSGYALSQPTPSLQQQWTVTSGATQDNHARIVEEARDTAVLRQRPLIVVAEVWTTGEATRDRRMRAATMLGLGAAWERWRDALERLNVPKSRIVRVNTQTWRAKVLGGPMARTTDQWKAAAIQHAKYGITKTTSTNYGAGLQMSEDEAEAICIVHWARHSGIVGAALKKAGKRYP